MDNYFDGFGIGFLFENEENKDILEKFISEVDNNIQDTNNARQIIAKIITKYLRNNLKDALEDSIYEGIDALVNDYEDIDANDEDKALVLSAMEIDELANEITDFICDNPEYTVSEAISRFL